MVKRIIETTDGVAPRERWDFWKDTTLAAVDARSVYDAAQFTAFRTLTQTRLGTLIETTSAPMSMTRPQSKIARDGVDHACLVVPVVGSGVINQFHRAEDVLRSGDLFLYDLGRPYTAASMERYHELRLYVPRDVFARRIGRIETLTGFQLKAGSGLLQMFTSYLVSYAKTLPALTAGEADIGMDGVIHLLSGLVNASLERAGDEGSKLSQDSVLGLAQRHIEALLADPTLNVAMLARAIGVSRTRLYNAFVTRGGVASAIREARLDRARRRLSAREDSRRTLEEIALLCGFAEYATFSKAFRSRFGMSPREAREQSV